MTTSVLTHQIIRFTENYKDVGGHDRQAHVDLELDMTGKTFKVFPSYGGKEFKFLSGSHQYAMWIAVSKCIRAAMEHAVEKLGLEMPLVSSDEPFDLAKFYKLSARARKGLIYAFARTFNQKQQLNETRAGFNRRVVNAFDTKKLSEISKATLLLEKNVGGITLYEIKDYYKDLGITLKDEPAL